MQIQTIGAQRTMSTREIAELTGKLVKHVNRDAEQMIDDLRASGEDGPDLDHVRIDRDAQKPAELSRMDILRLAMESEEAKIKAEAERDEAIRTKALIGSKREATATPTDVPDKRYGKVKAWPAAAWAICHDVNLSALFGAEVA